jgi:hypothetical protein
MQTVAVEPMIQAKVVRLPAAAVAVRLHMAPSYLLNVMAAPMIIIIQTAVMVRTRLCRTQTQLIVAAVQAQLVLNSIAMVAAIGKASHADLMVVLRQPDIQISVDNQLAVLKVCYMVDMRIRYNVSHCALLQICQS